jgi:site-specific recombinase XerD
MSALDFELSRYLAIRRALGFKLARAELLLADYLGHLDSIGTDVITTDNAVAWATLPPNGGSSWWGQRLSVVRAFARHLHAIDPVHEMPPTGLLPVRSHRAVPYLYSVAEIAALLTAARQLRSPLRAATFESLVGLLAVSGLRIGEALRLDRNDVELDDGVLHVRQTKFSNYAEDAVMPSRRERAVLDMENSHEVLGIIASE